MRLAEHFLFRVARDVQERFVGIGDAALHVGFADVSLVGFVGQWTGTGGVCCSAQVARKISGLMLMSDFDVVNDDVLDAMGETTNMIIGNLKDALEPTLGRLGLSTPTVVYGEHLKARSLNGERWTTVSFDCMGGILNVKVSLRPTGEAQGHIHNHHPRT